MCRRLPAEVQLIHGQKWRRRRNGHQQSRTNDCCGGDYSCGTHHLVLEVKLAAYARMIGWIRASKPFLLVLMGVLFAIFVVGIQVGLVGPNDLIAVPLALAFIVLLMCVLLT